VSPNRLPQAHQRELEWLAAVGHAQGRPTPEIAAQLAAQAGITRLWAWRLATGWTRAELLGRLRQLGDTTADESMLWRWEVGDRDPSSKHLDRLCRVYQTRPDRLGYGHDYTPAADARDHPEPTRGGADPSASRPPAVELRVLDPGHQALVFTWQVRDGHGHLLAHGQVAGAPNTPKLSGWRYQAFTEAAQAAITALKDLEAADRPPTTADRGQPADLAGRAPACDFCAATPAAWRYPARRDAITVRLQDALVLLQGGDWYACPACHLLVEAGKWDTLSERAHLPADQGDALWVTFRACRTGPARPLDRPEGRADG
jgi:transcriptional regulator with XRE-family HTH domain